MIGEEVGSASEPASLAVQLGELWCAAEPLSDRRHPEQDDYPWRDEIDLPIEPMLAAHGQFIAAWRTVLRWPALHAVRDEDSSTREPNPPQHLIDERAGSTNERPTFGVFCRAGCLTDEHHRC
jgi:hypothetical protein